MTKTQIINRMEILIEKYKQQGIERSELIKLGHDIMDLECTEIKHD